MANLQLNIEVNNEDFEKLCTDNINSLPKDKLEDILIKAVEVALIKDKENPSYCNDNNLLVTKVKNYYDYGQHLEPTELMKSVLNKIDLTPYTDVLAKTVADYIQNNYEEIIKKYVIEKFASLLFSDMNKWELKESIIRDLNHNV